MLMLLTSLHDYMGLNVFMYPMVYIIVVNTTYSNKIAYDNKLNLN